MKSPAKITPHKTHTKRQSNIDPKSLTQNINLNTTLRSNKMTPNHFSQTSKSPMNAKHQVNLSGTLSAANDPVMKKYYLSSTTNKHAPPKDTFKFHAVRRSQVVDKNHMSFNAASKVVKPPADPIIPLVSEAINRHFGRRSGSGTYTKPTINRSIYQPNTSF